MGVACISFYLSVLNPYKHLMETIFGLLWWIPQVPLWNTMFLGLSEKIIVRLVVKS